MGSEQKPTSMEQVADDTFRIVEEFLRLFCNQQESASSDGADACSKCQNCSKYSCTHKSDESVGGFDTLALSGLRLESAVKGRVIAKFPVTKKVTNAYNTLHGGCVATLVDTVGTAAVVTVSETTGVSVNLAVTYLLPIPAGQDVTVEAYVIRAGKMLSTTQVDLKLPNGDVAATGLHTKFMPGRGLWRTWASNGGASQVASSEQTRSKL